MVLDDLNVFHLICVFCIYHIRYVTIIVARYGVKKATFNVSFHCITLFKGVIQCAQSIYSQIFCRCDIIEQLHISKMLCLSTYDLYSTSVITIL